jgi:rod shape-determining protein MreB and related proteins
MFGIIDKMTGVFSIDMGVDLGTANTLVCIQGRGVVIAEPSVVAVRKGTNTVLLDGEAVGQRAKEMLGKTHSNIEAIRPLKDGVIADFEVTEAMLRYFIRKVQGGKRLLAAPQIVIAVPSGITQVEKRAVINSAERAGARRVFLIDEPMAAGLGVGLPIREAAGSLIVDIGGGTTEVAVMSLAGVACSESIRVAGDEMDESIATWMKKAHNLLIGVQMAEKIKICIGSAFPLEQEYEMTVRGRDLGNGLPKSVIVTSEEIREALREPVELIVSAIRRTLERTDPELSADLVHRGLALCGGGALLRGLDKRIQSAIDLQCHISADPLTAVARGTGQILENLDILKEILESAEDL